MFTEQFIFTIKAQEDISTCGWRLNVAQVSEFGKWFKRREEQSVKVFQEFSEILSV